MHHRSTPASARSAWWPNKAKVKKVYSTFILLVILSVSMVGQIDNINLKIFEIKELSKIYQIDSIPKILKGIAFNGVDTVFFFESNEKKLAIETYEKGFK